MAKDDVETECCPTCGALIALVGRRHRCLPPRGRGRPPLGDQPMTAAQRQRRSRAKRADEKFLTVAERKQRQRRWKERRKKLSNIKAALKRDKP